MIRWPWARPTPDPPPPGALVCLRFRRKYVPSVGAMYTVGEVAAFPPAIAADLVAAGIARVVKPGAVSRYPRPALPPAPAPDPYLDEIRAAVRTRGVWVPGWEEP